MEVPRTRVSNVASSILTKDLQERRAYLWQDHWIPNPQAEWIFKKLIDVIALYDNDTSMSIIGPSGIGKTKIIEAFIILHARSIRNHFDLDDSINPFLHTEYTSSGGQRGIYTRLLTDLHDPQPTKGTAPELLERVIGQLEQQDKKAVFLDDIHRLSSGGRSSSVQNGLRHGCRELADRSGVKIILLGTNKAREVIQANDETSRIFRCHELRRWNQRGEKNKSIYYSFLKDLEMVLPLRNDSYIEEDQEIRSFILQKTRGITSEIVQIIKDAVDFVMTTAKKPDDEVISLDVLKKIPYVPPSRHKNKG